MKKISKIMVYFPEDIAKKVAVKKIQENVENKPPEETKKRGVKDKPAGKAK